MSWQTHGTAGGRGLGPAHPAPPKVVATHDLPFVAHLLQCSRMDPRMTIANYLERESMSQDELARRVGLHRVTVSRYLNRSMDLAGDTVFRLLEEAGYTLCPRTTGQMAHPKGKQKGRSTMQSVQSLPAYDAVRELVEEVLDGSMEWRAGGAGGGGTWIIAVPGAKTLEIRMLPDRAITLLDELYIPSVEYPQRWDTDYNEDAPLKPTAIILLANALGLSVRFEPQPRGRA